MRDVPMREAGKPYSAAVFAAITLYKVGFPLCFADKYRIIPK
jgi:hypothetical protein